MSLISCELGTNCLALFKGHICREKWPLFLPIRFQWNWTIENSNNLLWWHCGEQSGVRELLQC